MAISQRWASSPTPESPFLELAKVRNFHQSSLHCNTSSSPGHWNSGGTSTFSDMRRQASRPGSLMIKWSLKAHSCQHSYDIAVDQASHLLVGNAGNSSCSVSSNSRQRFQLLGRSRHLAFQLLSNRYCCLSKPAAPGRERLSFNIGGAVKDYPHPVGDISKTDSQMGNRVGTVPRASAFCKDYLGYLSVQVFTLSNIQGPTRPLAPPPGWRQPDAPQWATWPSTSCNTPPQWQPLRKTTDFSLLR